MIIAILVAMPMFGSFLGNQGRVPRGLRRRERQQIMGRSQRQGGKRQSGGQNRHGQSPHPAVKGGLYARQKPDDGHNDMSIGSQRNAETGAPTQSLHGSR
jgi:hypothetical protein